MLEKKRKINVGVESKYINCITRIKSTEYLVERKNTYIKFPLTREDKFVTQRRHLRRVSLLDHCGFLAVD